MERLDGFPRDDAWRRHIPDAERLDESEIDLTGVNRDPNPLFDVICDALIEAQWAGGEIPEWGARVLARYLANSIEPQTSALHHFAVTGHTNLTRLAHELVGFAVTPETRASVATCAGLLAEYLVHVDEQDDDADGLAAWRHDTLRRLATPVALDPEADDETS